MSYEEVILMWNSYEFHMRFTRNSQKLVFTWVSCISSFELKFMWIDVSEICLCRFWVVSSSGTLQRQRVPTKLMVFKFLLNLHQFLKWQTTIKVYLFVMFFFFFKRMFARVYVGLNDRSLTIAFC